MSMLHWTAWWSPVAGRCSLAGLGRDTVGWDRQLAELLLQLSVWWTRSLLPSWCCRWKEAGGHCSNQRIAWHLLCFQMHSKMPQECHWHRHPPSPTASDAAERMPAGLSTAKPDQGCLSALALLISGIWQGFPSLDTEPYCV